jgi:hypothetical protein
MNKNVISINELQMTTKSNGQQPKPQSATESDNGDKPSPKHATHHEQQQATANNRRTNEQPPNERTTTGNRKQPQTTANNHTDNGKQRTTRGSTNNDEQQRIATSRMGKPVGTCTRHQRRKKVVEHNRILINTAKPQKRYKPIGTYRNPYEFQECTKNMQKPAKTHNIHQDFFGFLIESHKNANNSDNREYPQKRNLLQPTTDNDKSPIGSYKSSRK